MAVRKTPRTWVPLRQLQRLTEVVAPGPREFCERYADAKPDDFRANPYTRKEEVDEAVADRAIANYEKALVATLERRKRYEAYKSKRAEIGKAETEEAAKVKVPRDASPFDTSRPVIEDRYRRGALSSAERRARDKMVAGNPLRFGEWVKAGEPSK